MLNGAPTAPVEKTPAQLKKEAEKAAKLAKFAEKQSKQQQQKSSASENKTEVKKPAKEKVATEIVYNGVQTAGAKKDTSGPMPAAYSPRYVEAQWYSWWERAGFFKPEYYGDKAQGQFVMVIPPPNVTGVLHLGHALTNSIEDAICRWQRMQGKRVLWNPGCDHAGIATQVVVEKKLKRELNMSRHDLGREKFIEKVFEWKNEKGVYIYDQLRAMGSSVDWERARFTMDPKMCTAVTEAFVRLHDQGLIYRSTRLVHWSCSLKSAISDIEVDKMTLSGRTMLRVPGYEQPVEFGVFVLFAYRIDDSDEEVCVATTRVETMLGDTAVAVNPADARYTHLVGKTITHPFCGHKLRIVADEHADMTLGTGCVKITPAHDYNDYEVGVRHRLDMLSVIDDDGRISARCGAPFAGMRRYDARTALIDALKQRGMYRGTEENAGMIVPICSRSKDVIEPMLKPQWYVKCDNMAAQAKAIVDSGQLRIIPDMHIKTWHRWMDGSRDWCVSRQLWWGHRIPAYHVQIAGQPKGDEADNHYWVCGRTETEAMARAQDRFKVPRDKITLTWDSDVLDTWFSSALFPFSVMGWPAQTDDMRKYYPTSLLETGHDILFFWVARMVFFALALTDRLPFDEVYLHAMVRDAHGCKMTKSKGNVIDPMHVIQGATLDELHATLLTGNVDAREIDDARKSQREDYPQGIPECGTDALRFGLCAYTTQGRDINLDVLRVQGYRYFCNKIWQAMRFTLMQLGDDFCPMRPFQPKLQDTHIDKWIISRLAYAVQQCNAAFETYNFPLATTACYNFWQYEYCDVYLEYSKTVLSGPSAADASRCRQVLYVCADTALRLISPFMPYLSEELWQRLPHAPDDTAPSICVSRYPETAATADWRCAQLDEQFALVMDIVRTARSMRAVYELHPRQRTQTYVECRAGDTAVTVQTLSEVIGALACAQLVHVYVTGMSGGSYNSWQRPHSGVITQPVQDKCNGLFDAVKERTKLQKKLASVNVSVSRLRDVIDKPDYAVKVPREVQDANVFKMQALETEHAELTSALNAIQG